MTSEETLWKDYSRRCVDVALGNEDPVALTKEIIKSANDGHIKHEQAYLLVSIIRSGVEDGEGRPEGSLLKDIKKALG